MHYHQLYIHFSVSLFFVFYCWWWCRYYNYHSNYCNNNNNHLLIKLTASKCADKSDSLQFYFLTMWKNSLVEITGRAGKKAARAQLQKATKVVTADERLAQTSAVNRVAPLFSPASDALYASHDDYQNQLKGSVLQSSLEHGNPRLRAGDDSDALLRQAEQLPFLYAQEAFCSLVKAGEIQLALQLVSFWQPRKTGTAKLSHYKAKKELCQAICTLEQLKDSTTLKALISILNDSVKEQAFAQKRFLQAVALTHSRNSFSQLQYKLFAPLGVEVTSDILIYAIEAACRLGQQDGMSVLEKLLLADQCASCAVGEAVPTGTPRLPYSLYRQMEILQAEEKLDDSLIQQACPDLARKLVHPSHYRTVDILSLSVAEAKYIDEHWNVPDSLLPSSLMSDATSSAWRRIMRRVLPQSPALQSVEEKHLLISLLARERNITDVAVEQTRVRLRSRVIGLLKSPQQPVRRFTAAALLKNRHLISSLKISPVEILSIDAQSFYSKGNVDPSLCAFCNFAVRRLCGSGRYQDAARLTWNHLSVDCRATRRLFQTSPSAVDFAVLSMSRAMRDAAAANRAQNWMGQRSLALLRLAAVSGNHVTVLHCVPLCANALECGVSFAAVRDVLSDVFRADEAQKKWALNLVRLCSQSETVLTRPPPARCGAASDFRKLLASVWSMKGKQNDEPLLHSPSRSKQLALWETINDPQANPRLNALMLAAFLSDDVRKSILSCSYLTSSSANISDTKSASVAPSTADDIWSWEVAASIASNCTSPESYQRLLNCLKQRKPTSAESCTKDLDAVSAVLFSELEGHNAVFAAAASAEK